MCDAVSRYHSEMDDDTVPELEKIHKNGTNKEKEVSESNDDYVNKNQRSPFRRQVCDIWNY